MLVDSRKVGVESKQRGSTHIASSKFFSAMALLPSALSASAMASMLVERVLSEFYLICDPVGKSASEGELGIRQRFKRSISRSSSKWGLAELKAVNHVPSLLLNHMLIPLLFCQADLNVTII